MSLIGKVCSRGVWDETVPGISFDEKGISNYAVLFDMLTSAYPRAEVGKAEWDIFVEKIKSAGRNKKYDCLIGVSGGTDSSYLLYLAKEYGLRPLAVNLDNGWSSEIAVRNIFKMTTQLGIDLETFVIEYEEIKDLLRSYMMAGLPWIDIPTDLAIKSVLYKIASREKIKFILRGNDFRSEGTQPVEWTYGDGKQLKFVHKKYGRVPLKTFPNYTINNLLFYGLIKRIKSIYPFYYLDYSKQKAQQLLISKFGWEYYGGHHYENVFTRFAISWWLYEKFGIDKRKISFSAQILNGEMRREEAIQILNQPPYSVDEIEKIIPFILKKLDLTESDFDLLMKAEKKSYLDYPSNYHLIQNSKKWIKPLIKKIFVHKPQSFFQAEIRKDSK